MKRLILLLIPGLLAAEDIPPLFPVVNRFVSITWNEGGKPNPVEVFINSSRPGVTEISFSADASAYWLHVTPNVATTPAKLLVSADPAVPNAAGEIILSSSGATWEPVHIRVETHVVAAGAVSAGVAQVATGGGWETSLTLVNTGSTAAPFTLSFHDQNSGAPLPLNLIFTQTGVTQTTASVTQTLAPFASMLIETQGDGASMACSAQLSATAQVSGFAIFKHLPTGNQAVAPLETRTPGAFLLAYDNTGDLATGLAIANLTAQPASVPVVVRDDTGATLTQGLIQLAANGHAQFMLADAAQGYAATAGKRGTIEFQTPSGGRISALGIRATATGAITAIPVLAK